MTNNHSDSSLDMNTAKPLEPTHEASPTNTDSLDEESTNLTDGSTTPSLGVDVAEPLAPTQEPTPSDTEDLDDLRHQRDNYEDLLLRKTAEFENYRRRTERERVELSNAAASDLIMELLPLLDDLERALEAESESPEATAYRDGVKLIHHQLLELLRKRGVTPIEALGHPFDPNFHQAVLHETSTEHSDGEVTAELRGGYLLGKRLLRPTMVKVAKA